MGQFKKQLVQSLWIHFYHMILNLSNIVTLFQCIYVTALLIRIASEIPVRIYPWLVSNYCIVRLNSRYPIGKSLFRVNVDCPTDNAAGCRDVSWLRNSMTPDCTHWVVKPDLLNFQASNENFERGINENKIYLPALWICEKSKSGEPTRIDWRLNGSLRNRTSSKDWNLSNFIPSSL